MNWYKSYKHAGYDRRTITDTPEFRAWFGNSKVVDAQGQPLIVYKGMLPYDYTKENQATNYPGPEIEHIQRNEPFPTFDPADQEPLHLAGFFTDDPSVAKTFMFTHGAMYAVYLKIEKPCVFDAQGKPSGVIQFGATGKPFRDAIRSGKYDGAFILNTSDEKNVYIPLQPNQIKSAISNRGTYNPNDPRLVA